MLRCSIVLLLAPALAGCGAGGDADDLPSDSARVAGALAQPEHRARPWTMSHAGIGPLRAGMGLSTARTALGGGLELADPTASCQHVVVDGAPGRVLAMVVDGRVARIEIRDSAVATDRGARVGDSEARIDSLYRGEMTREPHKYTDGHYLVVRPMTASDSAYRLIFETDGERVLEYRAGLLPEVAWVEGCS